jgi:hypothetical protein
VATLTQYGLYKIIATFTLNSGSLPYYVGFGYDSSHSQWSWVAQSGLNQKYVTIVTNNSDTIQIYTDRAGDFAMSDYSFKSVTAPSNQGVTILDAIGGSQNFVSKDTSFSYNADSYQYKIF